MTTTPQLTPLRYETPTVTLEVMAREAAVSQWSDKPVVQVLRYCLQIQSPHDPGELTEIRGDRTSFLPLREGVQSYIQAQLTGLSDDSETPPPATPYLESQSLTHHTLHLGSLRTTTGNNVVSLTALQLADLGDVLEQLDAEVRPLPISVAPRPRQRSWRQWGTAAAGMVAAIGVTTTLWSGYRSTQIPGETAVESNESAPAQTDATAQSEESFSADLETDQDIQQELASSDETAASEDTDADLSQGLTERTPEFLGPEQPSTTTTNKNRPSTAAAQSSTQDSAAAKPPSQPPSSPPPSDTGDGAMSEAAPEAEAASAPAEPQPPTTTQPPAVSSRQEAGAEFESAEENAAAESNQEEALTPNPRRSSSESPANSGTSTPAPAPDVDPSSSDSDTLMLPQSPESLGSDALPLLSLMGLEAMIRDRWPPPDPPDQPVTYTLMIAADGTLEAVRPVDDLSTDYRSLTGIPEPGTVQFSTATPTTLRVLLEPDGAVDIVSDQ